MTTFGSGLVDRSLSSTPTFLLVPRVFLLPRPGEKMAESSFDSFVGQDIEFVSSWFRDQGLEGLIETFASK